MGHDFKKFPELTKNQLQFYYFESPHKQILEDFRGKVIRIIDGDTIRIKTDFRSFDFPIRLAGIAAPELDEPKGLESAVWLKNKILGQEVEVIINQDNRVGKFGRLIGDVIFLGSSMSEESLNFGYSLVFGEEAII